MKAEINQEKGWTLYSRDGPGASPAIRHHKSGEITLVSPADREDRVTLHSAAEIFFTISVLKQVKETKLKEALKEREGDLTITYTTAGGLIIRHRKLPGKQFHCASQTSLDFMVEVLTLISAQST